MGVEKYTKGQQKLYDFKTTYSQPTKNKIICTD